MQVLVDVNSLMIFTFLKKEAFRTNTRYILFAYTLFMDSFLMVLTDLALVASYFQYDIPWIACVLFCMAMTWFKTGTPLTLVERYVAICMSLRHADISTARIRLAGLVVIWWLSAVPAMVILFPSSPQWRFSCRPQLLSARWKSSSWRGGKTTCTPLCWKCISCGCLASSPSPISK